MGALKPNMAASVRSIRSVLMDEWDPIGVHGLPQAVDEYDSYAMPIYTILRQQLSKDSLLDYLHWMIEHMGLRASRDSLCSLTSKTTADPTQVYLGFGL